MSLAPLTKLRLTVVQFQPASGDYKRWDALGGDFAVAPDGSLTVPTLGAIDVAGLSAEQLGTLIAERLQAKLGLLDTPDASVQVLEYPPVYVVGSVSTPGEYAFRPGMTVMQALAVAGGEQRLDSAGGLSETIRLQADLTGFASDILRTTARLARLKTEFDRGSEIAFPPTLNASDPGISEIMEQERRIFDAHTNELSRQQTGLDQLGELYNAEIDALSQKSQAVDEQIARAEKQVESIQALVTSGSATTARLSDAERVLADLRSQRLDNVIATMTARENLNHSQRDLAKLQDEQQSAAAAQLQQEQANLEKLMLNQTSTMRMLRQSTEADANTTLARTAQMGLTYTIMRDKDGQSLSIDATEATPLLPGDLVKVSLQMQLPMGPTGGVAAATTSSQP
ncbi:polysaccharide biosynthesis/export family protein [Devosia epidermidihirudinis]|nr:polysaccharide biosynthesis/export family protein [Devosia epidermidihirudinis]